MWRFFFLIQFRMMIRARPLRRRQRQWWRWWWCLPTCVRVWVWVWVWSSSWRFFFSFRFHFDSSRGEKKNKKSNAYCIYFNRRIETACGNMRAMPLWTSNSTLLSDERLQSVLWLIQQFAVYSEGLLLPLLLLRFATCQEKHKKKYIINNTTVESYI